MSLPIGVVTLAERHGGITVTREIFEAMVAEVASHIAPLCRDQHRGMRRRMHMLGTSGTVTTIAGVHLDLQRYDRSRVDGCWMKDDEVNAVVERLLAMSYDERVGNRRASAPNAPIWCSRAARSWKRSAARFRASACASPTADCARACWCR